MKTPIAITLIVMGILLILTPALADFFLQRSVVSLLSKPGAEHVTLAGEMSELYRFGCWFSGSVVIAAAIFSSWDRKRVGTPVA